jgi:hypothetical protein
LPALPLPEPIVGRSEIRKKRSKIRGDSTKVALKIELFRLTGSEGFRLDIPRAQAVYNRAHTPRHARSPQIVDGSDRLTDKIERSPLDLGCILLRVGTNTNGTSQFFSFIFWGVGRGPHAAICAIFVRVIR